MFALILPMALKHAGAWPSHPTCMEGSPGPQWGRMEQYRGSDTYLTDLFQGGDKEVITHYRQRIEHVHGLEERREGVKVRVMTPCTKSLQCLPAPTLTPCPPPRSPNTPQMPAPGPLHVLFPLPRTRSPHINLAPSSVSFRSLG